MNTKGNRRYGETENRIEEVLLDLLNKKVWKRLQFLISARPQEFTGRLFFIPIMKISTH